MTLVGYIECFIFNFGDEMKAFFSDDHNKMERTPANTSISFISSLWNRLPKEKCAMEKKIKRLIICQTAIEF